MLNLDLATILFQVVNFLILMYLLNRFLFQPILRRAEQRVAQKEQLIADLMRERQEMATARARLDTVRQELDDQSDQIRGRVREEAEAERHAVLRQLRDEAAQVLVDAEADARRVQKQAFEEFRSELVDTVLFASGQVMRQVMPEQVNHTLVENLTQRVRDMGRAEMERVETLRRSLANREPVAEVTVADDLTTEQQGRLARILAALADQNVDLRVERDPDLIAGIRVRLGDTVIDNSIANQLHELRDQVLTALRERVNLA